MRAGDVDADGGGAFLVVAHRGEADADPRAQEEYRIGGADVIRYGADLGADARTEKV